MVTLPPPVTSFACFWVGGRSRRPRFAAAFLPPFPLVVSFFLLPCPFLRALPSWRPRDSTPCPPLAAPSHHCKAPGLQAGEALALLVLGEVPVRDYSSPRDLFRLLLGRRKVAKAPLRRCGLLAGLSLGGL